MSNRQRFVRRRFEQGKEKVTHAEDNYRRHGFRSPPMTPTITAFAQSPDRGRGLARDMRVRWALEEVGQPYEVRLVSFSAMKDRKSVV